MVRDVRERALPAPAADVGSLLDRLGGPGDVLWPTPAWQPMVLDRAVAVGAAGGHGGFRYRVRTHEPGRRVEFEFEPGQGARGWQALSVHAAGPAHSVLRYEARVRFTGVTRALWPLVVRPMRDAVLEDLLDRAEAAVGGRPVSPRRWSPRVRLLRLLFEDVRARETSVPRTRLLAEALPRVDFADAHAVARRPGMPDDPGLWAEAVFHDPPAWVVGLMGLREALVGLVGIARGGPSSFDPVARTTGEVLLGADERHLDFRGSVLVEAHRVVLSTVVRLRNRRGRAYFALVRRVHPVIVRAMLTRAARRLALRAHRAGADGRGPDGTGPGGTKPGGTGPDLARGAQWSR